MSWNRSVRQLHRWVSIAFTVAVILVIVASLTQEEPAEWVVYLPLPPLFVLLFTGLNLFALPYVAKRRSGRRSG